MAAWFCLDNNSSVKRRTLALKSFFSSEFHSLLKEGEFCGGEVEFGTTLSHSTTPLFPRYTPSFSSSTILTFPSHINQKFHTTLNNYCGQKLYSFLIERKTSIFAKCTLCTNCITLWSWKEKKKELSQITSCGFTVKRAQQRPRSERYTKRNGFIMKWYVMWYSLESQLNFFVATSSSIATLVSYSDPICTYVVQTATSECSSQDNQCSYTFQSFMVRVSRRP